MAETKVHYHGMPWHLWWPETAEAAYAAVQKIRIDIDALPVIWIRVKPGKRRTHCAAPHVQVGDSGKATKECAYVISGTAKRTVRTPVYRNSGRICLAGRRGVYKIYSSTQGPTAVERHAADVLGISMSRIEVDVTTTGREVLEEKRIRPLPGLFCALAADFHPKRR